MTIGDRIKLRRKEIGMSAEKVAEKVSLSPATIYRYEKGDIEKIPVEVLKQIADAIQTTPSYLMAYDGNPSSDDSFSMNRLQQLRVEKGISMKEAARQLNMPYTTYVNYEKGTREPNSETLILLANFYNVSIDYLIGRTSTDTSLIPSGFEPLPQTVRLPRVGQIACGTPILAETNIDSYDNVPQNWHADFTLLCKGDSMEPKIKDGDIVAIRKQESVENGEIAAVRVDCEATLKRVFLFPDHLELRAENPAFASILLIGDQMNDAHIEGKAVGLCRGL